MFGAMWKMGKGTPGNKWSKTSSDSLLPVSFTTLLTLILNDLNGSSRQSLCSRQWQPCAVLVRLFHLATVSAWATDFA